MLIKYPVGISIGIGIDMILMIALCMYFQVLYVANQYVEQRKTKLTERGIPPNKDMKFLCTYWIEQVLQKEDIMPWVSTFAPFLALSAAAFLSSFLLDFPV